jgi:hypothetical protein
MPLIPKTATEDLAQSIEATKAFIRGCFEKQPTAEEFETTLAFNMVVPAKIRGKAERFIQTALREWAYAKACQRPDHRGAELPRWLHRYNWHRPHGSIGAKPPISRLGLTTG